MTENSNYTRKSPEAYPKEWLVSEEERQDFKEADKQAVDKIVQLLKSKKKAD